MSIRFSRVALLALSLVAARGVPSVAGLYVGAGRNGETSNQVSAQADFSLNGSTLTVVLTNTTTGGTTVRGDILTGLAFNIDKVSPILTLSSVRLTDSSDHRFTSKTASDSTNPTVSNWSTTLGEHPIARYGAAVTGFNSAFRNPSGGSGGKNGIVADGTFPTPGGSGTSSSFNTAFPLYENSLTLTFAITGTPFTLDALKDVRFLFGTNGNGVIGGTFQTPSVPQGSSAVPEPATLASAGFAVLLGALARGRKRIAGR